MKRGFFLIIGAILIIAGCGYDYQNPNSEHSSDSPALVLTFDLSKSTIVPDLDMEPATYDVTGEGPNGATFEVYGITGNSVTVNSLAIGTWVINVNTKNVEGTVIGAGTTIVEIVENATVEASILVTPLEGEGDLLLTIDWTSLSGYDESADVTGTLNYQLGEGNYDSTMDIIFDKTSKIAISNSILNTGYYKLVLYLEQADKDSIFICKEAVRIVYGVTTFAAFSLTGNEGNVNITIETDMQEPIVIDLSGAQSTLESGTNMTVTAFTIPSLVDTYEWSLNGDVVGNASSITIGSELLEGDYTLGLIVCKDSRMGSASFEFTVSTGGSSSSEAWGYLILTINSSNVSNKTIVPDIDMDIACYDVIGTTTGGSFSETVGPDGILALEWLIVGTWIIHVDAKNDAGIIIADGYVAVEILANQFTTETVTVTPLEGDGYLELTIDWSQASQLTDAAVITGILTPAGGSPVTLNFSKTGKTAILTNTIWHVDYYMLSINIEEGDISGSYVDVVRIVYNATTSATIMVEDESCFGGLIFTILDDQDTPVTISFSGVQDPLTLGEDMTVTATTDPSPVDSYQWFLDGILLAGETNSSITIGSALLEREAPYRLSLIVSFGDIMSSESVDFHVVGSSSSSSTSSSSSIPPFIYEAEDGVWGNGAELMNYFISIAQYAGAYSEITEVDGGAGGNVTLTIRYATDINNTIKSLYVNGIDVLTLVFPNSGGWETFIDLQVTVNLMPGMTNTIKIQNDYADGDCDVVHIDKYIIEDQDTPVTIAFAGVQDPLTAGQDMTVIATTDPSPVDSYEWYLDGQLLAGETNSSITIGSALLEREAPYHLSLIVSLGDIMSSESVDFHVVDSCGPIIYEAEDGVWGSGAQLIDYYIGSMQCADAYSEITCVDGGSGGNVTLTIRYATAFTNAIKSLYVNGIDVLTLEFPNSGGWETFTDLQVTVNLMAGQMNTIKIQNDYADGDWEGVNIDKYIVH